MNVSLYVLKQYVSSASRRELQWLDLESESVKVELWGQAQGNNDPINGSNIKRVFKWPNPFAVFNSLRPLKRWLDVCYFPSPTMLYVWPATSHLSRAVGLDLREGRSVCLITPVPPHDLLMAGLAIKRRYPQIRWIVDWQDLWSFDDSYFGRLPRKWRQRVLALEREVAETCDLNVVTNDRATRALTARAGPVSVCVCAIPHAYERRLYTTPYSEDSFAERRERPRRIGFLGNFFKNPKVPGDRVLQAFDEARIHNTAFELHIHGDKSLQKDGRPLLNRPWIVYHPREPHDASMTAVSASDWLLVTLADSPNTRVTLHAKLPYYLALGKPIVALVPEDSAVADLIRETGTGIVFGDERSWGKRLAELFADRDPFKQAVCRNEKAVARYSWSELRHRWMDAIGLPDNEGVRGASVSSPNLE